MKVWLATAGCYSDFSVIGVFSTRKAAEEVSRMSHDGNNPACYEVDELEGGSRKDKFYCHLEMKTGKVVNQGVTQGYQVVPKNTRVGSPAYLFGPVPQHNTIINAESYVSAKHALKLAIEYRQKLLRKKTEPHV
jgi:hypothetical protein